MILKLFAFIYFATFVAGVAATKKLIHQSRQCNPKEMVSFNRHFILVFNLFIIWVNDFNSAAVTSLQVISVNKMFNPESKRLKRTEPPEQNLKRLRLGLVWTNERRGQREERFHHQRVSLALMSYDFVGGIVDDSNNVNMKVLMSCPSQPSSCRNIKSTKDREIVTLASGMKVMCDTQTDGGGWIIIQRRINGKIPFYRGWEEYRYGFGNYTIGEFYLGNENIYQLTTKRYHELRIDLKFNNVSYYAKYSRFRIMGENDNYRIKAADYSGSAGDSLLSHNMDMPFSTFDKDNDNSNGNCALSYKGAWWYNSCHDSNLNGDWGSKDYGQGMVWLTQTTHYASATFTEMKIREVEL